MIETRIQDTHIIITDTVTNIFMNFRQFHEYDSERGGIVLGQVNESNDKILVCRATIPSDVDGRGKTSFRRNRIFAQHMVEYEFYNSERKNTYLGEWHTHPAKTASASQRDLSMIKQQFEENDIKVKFILMFIIARDELYVGTYNGSAINSVTISIGSV
jgi:integrative and conjugative element protein (TIGR02256 family)